MKLSCESCNVEAVETVVSPGQLTARHYDSGVLHDIVLGFRRCRGGWSSAGNNSDMVILLKHLLPR